MTAASRIPSAPVPNPETASWWALAVNHRWSVPRCRDCGRSFWYPRAVCPHCFGSAVEYEASRGRGVIYAFTWMRREKQPYVLAYVRLEEGITVMTNIVDCDPGTLRIGQSVRVTFVQAEGGIPVPMFTPCEADAP